MKENDRKELTALEIIETTGDGDLRRDIETEYQKLIEAVKRRGGAGKITITLKLSPSKQYETVCDVVGEVSATLPKKPAAASLLFFTPYGLVADKRDQGNLFDAPLVESTNESTRS